MDECDNEFRMRIVNTRRRCVGKRLSYEAQQLKAQTARNEIARSFGRQKRIAPAIWAAGYVVIAGFEVFNVVRTEINSENIKTLAEASEAGKMKEAAEALDILRKNVNSIHERLDVVEKKIAYLNETVNGYVTAIKLVSLYNRLFTVYEGALLEADYLFGTDNPTASPLLSRLLNHTIYDSKVTPWTVVSECDIAEAKKNVILKYKVMAPNLERKVRIYRHDAIRYWNETSKGTYCSMVYVGPSHVMLNETNNCMLEITDATIPDKFVVGYKCLKTDGGLDYKGRLFDKTVCETDMKKIKGVVQIRHLALEHKIYCWGHKIEIGDKSFDCPVTSFYVPLTETYSVGGRTHTSHTVTGVYVDPLDVQFNKDIMKRLNGEKANFYSGNFTGTGDDKLLTRIVSKLKEGSQVKLKDFPGLMDPMEGMRKFINKIVDVIEEGLAIMGFIILAIVILMSIPMLHALITSSRLFARIIGIIGRKIRSILSFFSRNRGRRRNSQEYWKSVYGEPLHMN